MEKLTELWNKLNEKSNQLMDGIDEYIKMMTIYSGHIKDNYPEIHNEAVRKIKNEEIELEDYDELLVIGKNYGFIR